MLPVKNTSSKTKLERSSSTRSRVTSTILFLSIGLTLLIGSFSLVVIVLYARSPQTTPPATHAPPSPVKTSKKVTQISMGLPSRVAVPVIGVDTTTVPVGIAADGTMEIDKNIERTAWYKLGPKPGEVGSAVIAGHYGWVRNQPSVFNNLNTLKANDTVQVYDDQNNLATFVVKEVRSYDPTADATEVFRSSDGKAHLNLITCEGTWNESLQTYSQRLVVFTDLVSVSKT